MPDLLTPDDVADDHSFIRNFDPDHGPDSDDLYVGRCDLGHPIFAGGIYETDEQAVSRHYRDAHWSDG